MSWSPRQHDTLQLLFSWISCCNIETIAGQQSFYKVWESCSLLLWLQAAYFQVSMIERVNSIIHPAISSVCYTFFFVFLVITYVTILYCSHVLPFLRDNLHIFNFDLFPHLTFINFSLTEVPKSTLNAELFKQSIRF